LGVLFYILIDKGLDLTKVEVALLTGVDYYEFFLELRLEFTDETIAFLTFEDDYEI
jgi:hypothetical protein